MNIFSTVLTHAAPTANYRGESEMNRTVIQKITDGRFEYPIISPEAMRNALREIIAGPGYDLPANRERLHDEEQLAVRFNDFPDPDKYADDFIFGYLIAAGSKDREKIRTEVKRKDFSFKRDSVLRMNLAKGLEPYRHDAIFTQSPLASEDSKYRNSTSSALLHRETADTAFQYPFALTRADFTGHFDWGKKLLAAIGELANVSGNHARSLYFMAPASIVIRVTDRLAPGYEQYHFTVRRDASTNSRIYDSKILKRLTASEEILPGTEFFIGGEIVEGLADEHDTAVSAWESKDPKAVRPKTRWDMLCERKVTLDKNPARLLKLVADKVFK